MKGEGWAKGRFYLFLIFLDRRKNQCIPKKGKRASLKRRLKLLIEGTLPLI